MEKGLFLMVEGEYIRKSDIVGVKRLYYDEEGQFVTLAVQFASGRAMMQLDLAKNEETKLLESLCRRK